VKVRTARLLGSWLGGIAALLLGAVLVWQWGQFALAGLGPGTPAALFIWLAVGVNLAAWATVGMVRLADDSVRSYTARRRARISSPRPPDGPDPAQERVLVAASGPSVPGTAEGLSPRPDADTSPGAESGVPATRTATAVDDPDAPTQLAVIIPAHNEEPVINAAIRSALRLFDRWDIYVVSDSSGDSTADIAAKTGVNVLELLSNKGKAGAIEALITEFRLTERYDGVVILDADTELDAHYVEGVKRQLRDPKVAAVAGFVQAEWNPHERSAVGRAIAAYRDRLYFLLQYLIRFGQTWRHTSTTFIIPGFASTYRSSALKELDVNPKGLVIEDFNMTFEVHRKRLGRISMHPDTRAVCQDPYTLGDYVSQVRRWTLGFWQTVRRHGVWPSLFWFALFFYILEVLLVSVVVLTTAALAVFTALPPVTGGAVLEMGWYAQGYDAVTTLLPLTVIAIGLFVPDYILTCLMAVIRRRPGYLVYGLFFLAFRVIDSFLTLRTLPMAWTARSDGRWKSPGRALRA
jgi:poly-beta-1,6-N-acetyl-D-glucosamine synthase